MIDGIAQRHGAVLVFAHRFEDHAERRIDDAPDRKDPDHKHSQHKIIHIHGLIKVDEAKEIAARHTLKAIFAVCKGCLQTEEEEHLRQRQRDHR